MKNSTLLARFVLGLIFITLSLNFWFKFITLPNPEGVAASFMEALFATGYLALIKLLELAGGLLIWTGRFTALGLVILVPILVNIVAFDIFLVGGLNPLSMLASLLALFLLWTERRRFLGLVR